MKLVISQLKDGENPLSFDSEKDPELKAVARDLGTEGFKILSPLKFQGILHKHEPDYYLNGNLDWNVEQVCSRCAETFSSPLHYDFQLALAHSGAHKKAKNADLVAEESEDLDLVFFEGNELDLKPLLHEQFVLSLPFKSLCKETCKGVCQHCGMNLNRQECKCVNIPKENPFSVLKTITL